MRLNYHQTVIPNPNGAGTMEIIDLRSDTVTRPTAAMRDAMANAPVGDDTYGDDPSVNALQEKIAAMLGFEAAIFVPSGTQSNFCAILAHCERGDEYIVGQMAHAYRWEGGGAAMFGSVQPQPLEHQADGTLALAAIRAAVKPDDPHFARTRLLALENTWGGKLLPYSYVQQATALATELGLARHLDGARLFNAAALQAQQTGGELRAEARRIAQCFDSVSVCFSKGLGAPIGSALCGSRALIARARRIRKASGGSMRQAGIVAAAALHALDHHLDRLEDDHANARRLAEGLAGIEALKVETPQTNMVFASFTDAAVQALGRSATELTTDLSQHLRQQGIVVTGAYNLRLVTHLDIDSAAVDRTVAAIQQFFALHALTH
jgi:threonine aldolase